MMSTQTVRLLLHKQNTLSLRHISSSVDVL
jgi:hypothetical protein